MGAQTFLPSLLLCVFVCARKRERIIKRERDRVKERERESVGDTEIYAKFIIIKSVCECAKERERK